MKRLVLAVAALALAGCKGFDAFGGGSSSTIVRVIV